MLLFNIILILLLVLLFGCCSAQESSQLLRHRREDEKSAENEYQLDPNFRYLPLRKTAANLQESSQLLRHRRDAKTQASTTSGSLLKYYGGPVLSNVQIITIWWGGSSRVKYTAEMEKFYAAVTSSTWFSVFYQYKTANQTIGKGSWLSSYNDTTAPNGTIGDSIIQARLTTLLTDGLLPAPNGNRYYVFHLPPDVGTFAFCKAYCAYHGALSYSGLNVPFAVIPDMDSCPSGCEWTSPGPKNYYTIASHELAEAVTDPIPGASWYNMTLGENGDICEWQITSTKGSDGNTYAVHKTWSNSAKACV